MEAAWWLKNESKIKPLDTVIGGFAYTLWDMKEGGNRLREFSHLAKAQYLESSELQNLQETRLTALVQHAEKTSLWYKDLIEEAGLRDKATITLEDLKRLPVTTKTDIRNNTDQFISRAYRKESLNRAKTGGSTGVSLNLYFDDRCQQWRNAAQMYADSLAGWKKGTRVAAVWPSCSQNPEAASSTLSTGAHYLSRYHGFERFLYEGICRQVAQIPA